MQSGWDATSANESRSRRGEIAVAVVGNCIYASLVFQSTAIAADHSLVRETLSTLQGCLRKIPKMGNEYVATHCEGGNLAVLSGTSPQSMVSALWPPTLCFQNVTASPIDKSRWRPAWLFYYLPNGWRGGGPELVCPTDDGVICR
jgi:hypothetical protein